ncbi:hypothetical protein HYFRA_00004312 [Hymenoscyphus fraxineus]|uniref:Transmembrane protein n=1 Tax=Hymenoscyphus fraxineus TaxID=746836 RepID=A0A9N9KPY7_9HELO|nr:hypothetical protein HYFRA_00004312 [Hymenoscyphus fraxineus]
MWIGSTIPLPTGAAAKAMDSKADLALVNDTILLMIFHVFCLIAFIVYIWIESAKERKSTFTIVALVLLFGLVCVNMAVNLAIEIWSCLRYNYLVHGYWLYMNRSSLAVVCFIFVYLFCTFVVLLLQDIIEYRQETRRAMDEEWESTELEECIMPASQILESKTSEGNGIEEGGEDVPSLHPPADKEGEGEGEKPSAKNGEQKKLEPGGT